jgi:hypothetical protein
MDSLGMNPFAILTFIAAPAVLTNSSSVMALGTSNRLARAIERVRTLSAMMQDKAILQSPEIHLRVRQIRMGEQRVLLMVRAMTTFYLAVGAFAAASLVSLFGAIFHMLQMEILKTACLAAATLVGITGVGAMIGGSTLLVLETRLALAGLRIEIDFRLRDFSASLDSLSIPPEKQSAKPIA